MLPLTVAPYDLPVTGLLLGSSDSMSTCKTRQRRSVLAVAQSVTKIIQIITAMASLHEHSMHWTFSTINGCTARTSAEIVSSSLEIQYSVADYVVEHRQERYIESCRSCNGGLSTAHSNMWDLHPK